MERPYCTVEEALEELRSGRIIISIDDPDRENEGDMICAAQFATTERHSNLAVSLIKIHSNLGCIPYWKREGTPKSNGKQCCFSFNKIYLLIYQIYLYIIVYILIITECLKTE